MATIAWIANASTGNWSTAANWSSGAVPTINDEVAIGVNGNSGTGITVSAASSGATSITLAGTSIVLKRGTIIAIAGTVGLYSLRGDRTGNGAVSIDPPLRAAVTASSALTYYNGGAECVVDTAAAVCGADSRYGLLVTTLLKASRSVSTLITARGSVSVIQTTGKLDYGSPADPIPSGVTAGILFDLGASPTANKYGLLLGRHGANDPAGPTTTSDCGGAFMWGATKTAWSDMSVGITAGGSTFTVPDVTGWAVGDRVAVPPSGNYTNQETRVISGITGAGPYEVTVSSPWTYAHAAGLPAMNLTRNVYIGVVGSAQPSCVHMHAASTATPDSYRIGYVEFATGGGPTVVGGIACISTTVWNATTVPWRDIVGCSFHHRMRDGTNIATHQGIGPAGNAVTTWPMVWDHCVIFEESRTGNNIALIAGALYYLTDCVSVGGSYGLFSGFSQGGQGSIFTRLRMYGAGTVYSPNPCINLAFIDCTLDNHNWTFLPQSGAFTFDGGEIGQGYIGSSTMCQFGAANQSITATFTDTLFPAGATLIQDSDFIRLSASFKFTLVNKDADATKQEEWTRPGLVARDNATINRGRSSVKITLKSSTVPKVWSVPFAASAGIAARVVGYVRHDATYGSANPVSVSLSGAGSTPATFAAATSVDAWQKFDLTVTPSANGTVTLAVTALSDAVNGNVWLDGVSHAPWIDWAWHYGMAYAPALPTVTVDANIVAIEATAIAYAGFAWSGGTLTVSASHTGQELYDWHAAYCAANQLAPFVTGTPAQPVIAGNITVTGSGVVLTATKVTATGTITFSAGASASPALIWVDATTTSVPIVVDGIRSGSRVRIVRTDTEAEIAIGLAGASGFTARVTWAADLPIRADTTYTSGLDCEQEASALGTLTANGALLTVVQTPCTTYEANGYTGADVTGLTLDAPNVEADADEFDNRMAVQEFFAWYKYTLMSEAGIRTLFGAITAENAHKYRVNASKCPLKIDQKDTVNTLLFTGGLIYRDDGESIRLAGSGSIEMIPDDVYESAAAEADITAIRNVIDADERHLTTETGRKVQKLLRGTSTILLEKNVTGTPLVDLAVTD